MAKYKITEVRGMQTKPKKDGSGDFRIFTFRLEGVEGDVDVLEFDGKVPPPEVGHEVEGEIETNQYGKSLRQKSKGGGGGRRGRSPAETAAIQHQHSQEMAIRAVAEMRWLDLIPREGAEGAVTKMEDWLALVRRIAVWFDADIVAAIESRTTEKETTDG